MIAQVEVLNPRSMNAGAGAHPRVQHARKRRLTGELATLLLAAGVPRPIPGDRVHATADILFPTQRRRDEGNYRSVLEKALGDALSPHKPEHPWRWLTDDTPDHFTFGAITFGLTPELGWKPGRAAAVAVITLAWGEHLPTEGASHAADA